MSSREILRSISSLAVAIVLSLLVGSTLGWSSNPDQGDAFEYAATQMEQTDYYGTEDEVGAKFLEHAKQHPSYNADYPNTYIAILKSNPILLGLFGFVGLLLFRPSTYGVLIIFTPFSGIAMLSISFLSGVSILLFTATFVGITIAYSKMNSSKAT